MRITPALLLTLAFGCASDSPAPAVDAMGDPICPADWWDCEFTSRRSVQVAPTNETLTNFPLLVSLNESQIADVKDQGADLRFIGAQGALLPYEIDSWNDSGAQIWVRAASLAADEATTLMMYWSNSAADAPGNAKEVWADGYQAVWHLNAPPSEGAADSSGNENTGTAKGQLESRTIAGIVGASVDFDGADDWIEVAHSASLDITENAITVSAWAYLSGAQTADGGIIVKALSGGASDYNYQIGVQNTQFANFRAKTDNQTYITGLSPLETQRWYYISGVYNGSTSTIYVNGHADRVLPQTGPVVSVADPLLLGRRHLTDDRFFKGRIDEARVSSVARSQAWLRAEFRNVTGDLVTLGEVEGF